MEGTISQCWRRYLPSKWLFRYFSRESVMLNITNCVIVALCCKRCRACPCALVRLVQPWQQSKLWAVCGLLVLRQRPVNGATAANILRNRCAFYMAYWYRYLLSHSTVWEILSTQTIHTQCSVVIKPSIQILNKLLYTVRPLWKVMLTMCLEIQKRHVVLVFSSCAQRVSRWFALKDFFFRLHLPLWWMRHALSPNLGFRV